MKKTITIITLSLIVFACHRKTIAQSDSTVPPEKTDDAQTELVAAGKTVYTNRCGRCHGLKNPANFTAERWDNILNSMIPKARLNETEAEQVRAYVKANAKN